MNVQYGMTNTGISIAQVLYNIKHNSMPNYFIQSNKKKNAQ